MTTAFKNKWKEMRKHDALLDLETLDFQINEMTIRMAEAPSYSAWSDLFHERERMQILREGIARSL